MKTVGQNVKSFSGFTGITLDIGVLECQTDKGACTIQLPNIFGSNADDLGYKLAVQDTGNNASTNNITIKAVTGQKINGQDSITITTNGDGLVLIPFGNSYWVATSMASSSGGGGLTYLGTWNANTNTPTITSGVGTSGDYYVVNVAGTTNIDGIDDWGVGDWIIFNGSAWQKIDNSDVVTSVNGQQGAVLLGLSDVLSQSNSTSGNNIVVTDGDSVDFGGNATISYNDSVEAFLVIDPKSTDGVLIGDYNSGNYKGLVVDSSGAISLQTDSGEPTLGFVGDSFSGGLSQLPLTATRTWNLPDKSGTIALLSDVTSFYTSDGTLSSNRIVSGDGNQLTFNDVDSFTVTAGSNGLYLEATDGSDFDLQVTGGGNMQITNGNSLISTSNAGQRFTDGNTEISLGVQGATAQAGDIILVTDKTDPSNNPFLILSQSDGRIEFSNATDSGQFQMDGNGSFWSYEEGVGKNLQINMDIDDMRITAGTDQDIIINATTGTGWLGLNSFSQFDDASVSIGGKTQINSVLVVGSSNAIGNSNVIFEIQTNGGALAMRKEPITSVNASAITPLEGMLIFVSDTNATFTSIGFWGYENGVWSKL